MTTPLLQGERTIARMCALGAVSRAGYYRHWTASAPREEETAMRDLVQRVALAEPHYGYRRVTIELRRAGVVVNHKRVLCLMHEDNLLCLRRRAFAPATTDSNHGWQVVPNRTRGIVLTGIDQLWVADITYIRMREEFAYLAVVLDAFSRRVIGWARSKRICRRVWRPPRCRWQSWLAVRCPAA
jgi:transposase InsO family protein